MHDIDFVWTLLSLLRSSFASSFAHGAVKSHGKKHKVFFNWISSYSEFLSLIVVSYSSVQELYACSIWTTASNRQGSLEDTTALGIQAGWSILRGGATTLRWVHAFHCAGFFERNRSRDGFQSSLAVLAIMIRLIRLCNTLGLANYGIAAVIPHKTW